MEREALDSVVFTLLQFPTVEEVEIIVEGTVLGVFPEYKGRYLVLTRGALIWK